jgi:hypothetical protein
MKNRTTVRKLPRELLIVLSIFLCTALILCAFNIMYAAAMRGLTLKGILPPAAVQALVPSVALSIAFAGMRLSRRPVPLLLGQGIVLGAGLFLLVGGLLWMGPRAGKAAVVPGAPSRYFATSTFVHVGDKVISAQSVGETSLIDVLVFDPQPMADHFSVAASGSAASTPDGTLTVTTAADSPVTLASAQYQPAGTWIFASDRFTTRLLRDVGVVTQDLGQLRTSSPGLLFVVSLALLFLWTSLLAILRLTRWPLANLFLLLVAVRVSFSLYRLLAVTLAPRIASSVAGPLAAHMLPVAIFTVIGAAIVAADARILSRWGRREQS